MITQQLEATKRRDGTQLAQIFETALVAGNTPVVQARAAPSLPHARMHAHAHALPALMHAKTVAFGPRRPKPKASTQ